MTTELPKQFFRPTARIAEELLDATGEYTVIKARYSDSMLDRISDDITLRLWHYLARVARSAALETDNDASARIHLDAETVSRMAAEIQHSLALDEEAEDLARRLLRDFLNWLYDRPEHEFNAPWGRMTYDGEDLSFAGVAVPRLLKGQYTRGTSLRNKDSILLLGRTMTEAVEQRGREALRNRADREEEPA